MADRFPGEITLGGHIPLRLLDELAERIASEGLGINWQEALDPTAVRRAIELAAERSETVRFTDDEALYGQFEELEDWLTRHGIDFDRHSDARYEHDAENVYGRGRRKPVVMSSDQSGGDLVSVESIREILGCRDAPVRKLARIAKLVAVPQALTPIVLMGASASMTGRSPGSS